jgi:hypothetical protein
MAITWEWPLTVSLRYCRRALGGAAETSLNWIVTECVWELTAVDATVDAVSAAAGALVSFSPPQAVSPADRAAIRISAENLFIVTVIRYLLVSMMRPLSGQFNMFKS